MCVCVCVCVCINIYSLQSLNSRSAHMKYPGNVIVNISFNDYFKEITIRYIP